jgi:hypothetical protein
VQPRLRRREAFSGWCDAVAVCAALASMMLGVPGISSAQESSVYIGGSAMLSTQGSHRQGSAPSLPTTGAGGDAIGGVVEAGGLLTSRIGLGIEISVPSRFTALQETDYSRVFQQESRHRDLALSAVAREIVFSTQRVRLGLVEGIGFVQESTLQRRRDQATPLPTFPPTFGPYSDEYAFTRWTRAAVVGGDIETPVTPHLAIVPAVRLHFIKRSSDPGEPGWALGLSSIVVRAELGLRATF